MKKGVLGHCVCIGSLLDLTCAEQQHLQHRLRFGMLYVSYPAPASPFAASAILVAYHRHFLSQIGRSPWTEGPAFPHRLVTLTNWSLLAFGPQIGGDWQPEP